MNLGIIVESTPKYGGEWHNSINVIKRLKLFLPKDINIRIYCINAKSIKAMQSYQINASFLKINFFDKIIKFLYRRFFFFNISTSFEKKLIKDSIDCVYFTNFSANLILVNKINFIPTVLDLAHLNFRNFPEVGGKVFYNREWLLKKFLKKSFLIISDSKKLKDKINKIYKIKKDKILIMPYLYSSSLKIKKKNSLFNFNFLFYPANFWKHKNHDFIIEALRILKSKYKLKCIFTGYDKGYLNNLEYKIKNYKLKNDILIYKNSSDIMLNNFYNNCEAVIMPTFFGPTNIPPVEAWFMKKPLIYSHHLKDHARDAALYVDPLNPESLIKIYQKILDKKIKDQLIFNGNKRLELLENQTLKSIKFIGKALKNKKSFDKN